MRITADIRKSENTDFYQCPQMFGDVSQKFEDMFISKYIFRGSAFGKEVYTVSRQTDKNLQGLLL